MSKTMILVHIAVLLTATNICPAAEGADPLKYGLSADYFSKYIWRGQNVNDESVFQPSVYVSKWGVTGSVWTNMDLTHENNNADEFTEVDYSLDYTSAIPGITGINFSLGTVYYRFPNTDFKSTSEVYAGMSLGCTCGASNPGHCLACFCAPWFKVYRDVDEVKNGAYYQFGVGRTIQKVTSLADDCVVDCVLGASAGYGNSHYNRGYFGVNAAKMNDLTLSIALPVVVGKWTVKPSVNYSMILSEDIRRATVNSDNVWGGLSLSCNF
jgi:hypothetical protein